ncbi:cytochrome c [Phyllobacterium sp. 1468]|uniref:c-type cytochrome n=1 Tax=Phyllobacterium sp. 1468 TaxID=2817759 RepID=UPI00286720D5|nr:hypothetical protein [Phyllobacterium sp. 1468]MDR6636357.1 cytochrome c [Phyllobacterium sp. 1468]
MPLAPEPDTRFFALGLVGGLTCPLALAQDDGQTAFNNICRTNLDQFIANPDQVVRGNSMKPYGGITDAAQRKTIIEFLKSGD